jgi:hypothetical protein
MLDRAMTVLVTMFLGWLVKRGYIGESDSATLLPAIVLLPAIAYGAWVNRDKALIQSAGNVVDPVTGKPTIIVTSPAMAAATPGQNNIVSTSDVKVIQK